MLLPLLLLKVRVIIIILLYKAPRMQREYYPEIKHFQQFRQLSAISAEYRNCQRFRNCRRLRNCRSMEISADLPAPELSGFSISSTISADIPAISAICRIPRNITFRHFRGFRPFQQILPKIPACAENAEFIENFQILDMYECRGSAYNNKFFKKALSTRVPFRGTNIEKKWGQ